MIASGGILPNSRNNIRDTRKMERIIQSSKSQKNFAFTSLIQPCVCVCVCVSKKVESYFFICILARLLLRDLHVALDSDCLSFA